MDLSVITTYRCNSKCQMCYIWKNPTLPKEEVSIETLSKLPNGFDNVNITGGEPTLRSDLMEICDVLHPKSKTLEISTNGLKPDLLIPIVRKYPNIKIRFSLEGKEDTNNIIRGENDGFNKKMEGMKKLIEAGGKDTNPWIHIPGGYFKTMLNPKTDWCFQTEKEEFCDNREMVYPRGKTLGGSSSINGMLYIRGQSNDYNYWRQLGNVGWSWEDVLPYFKKSEDFEFGKNEFHGSGGPLAVEKIRGTFKVLDLFLEAAEEFGHKKTDDFNDGDNEGMGYFPFTVRKGFRCSTAVGYLNPIKKRQNLKIVTNAHIKNIEFDNKKANKVNYWVNNKIITTKVNKEIILSAGTIGSPHILQASGIGPGNLLKNNNVEVIKDHSGVGGNLTDHLMLRPVY